MLASPAGSPVPPHARRLLGVAAIAWGMGALGSPNGLVDAQSEWIRGHLGGISAAFALASLAQIVVVPFLALLSDKTRLSGGRRRAWIVLTALGLAAFWFLFDPRASGGVSSAFGLAAAALLLRLLSAVAGGLAVDVGLRNGVTGAASGAYGLAFGGATLLTSLGRILLRGDATASSRVLAIAFACVAAAVLVFGREEPATLASPPPDAPTFRSRGFWAGVLSLMWLNLLQEISRLSLQHRGLDPHAVLLVDWIVPAVLCLYAGLYGARSGRLDPGRLPAAIFALGVAATALLAASPVLSPAVQDAGITVLVGLAWLPVLDLAMRSLRPGAAAFGFFWLVTIPRFVTKAVATPLLMTDMRAPVTTSSLLFAAAGAVVVGAVAWRLSRGAVAAG
jgi:hypothetical protein